MAAGGAFYDPVAGTIILDRHSSSFADLEVRRKLREIIDSVPKFDLTKSLSRLGPLADSRG